MTLGALIEALCSDSVGEGEETAVLWPMLLDTFDDQFKLSLQHAHKPSTGDIATVCRRAVDLIAELHAIGGHDLGDRASCRARLEEPASYFLASADFCDGPIFQGVQV